MSLGSIPSVSGYISVKKDDVVLFQQEIRKMDAFGEISEFINEKGQSVPESSLFKATIIPLRTDSWKDFAKDLFLPTVVNHAIKTDGIVLKVFASLFAIALDVVTFIPRLVISPFKAVYDRKHKTEHPLATLIKNKPGGAEAIKSGTVQIAIDFNETIVGESEKIDFSIKGSKTVTIRPLPRVINDANFTHSRRVFRKTDQGEWTFAHSREPNWAVLRNHDDPAWNFKAKKPEVPRILLILFG